MKTLHFYLAGLGFLLSAGSIAQESNPDQNPNYKVSMDYYMENRQTLTANQGQTVQQTYEAFDWTKYKADLKQERKDRHYEMKKMRYQSRYRCNYGNPYNYNYNYNPYYSPYYSPLLYGAGIYSFIF